MMSTTLRIGLWFSGFLSSDAGDSVSEAAMLDMFSGVGGAKLKFTGAAVTNNEAVGEEVTGDWGSPPAAVATTFSWPF